MSAAKKLQLPDLSDDAKALLGCVFARAGDFEVRDPKLLTARARNAFGELVQKGELEFQRMPRSETGGVRYRRGFPQPAACTQWVIRNPHARGWTLYVDGTGRV